MDSNHAWRRFRHQAKRVVERSLQVRFYRRLPYGIDHCDDIIETGHPIRTIFDVGANKGQAAREYLERFPTATIFCFEPVRQTFEALRDALESERTNCHHLAMGSAEGRALIHVTDLSTTSSMVPPKHWIRTEEAVVSTVDVFASQHSIPEIDVLKVDTEGLDLEVIKGASGILERGGVHFVLIELGFRVGDTRHVLLDEVRNYLAGYGYAVMGFYNQTKEWSGEPRLRYADVLFARQP